VRLAQDFDVRRYAFDSRLTSVEGFGAVAFDGSASSLRSALTTLAERYKSRPVAGVLLFTDGNPTDWSPTALSVWRDFAPLYPVTLRGSAGAGVDVAIENIAVTTTSFEDAPVSIQADVRVLGDVGAQLVGQLVTQDGALVQELREPIASGKSLALRFQARPEKPGLTFYRVRVAPADTVAQFDDPKATREATLANNSRLVAINREQGPYRVLYVSGRPNWEFKFLRRAVEDDDEVDLVGMIRIARKEAKFDFRGRAGESSNPLFRGFKEKPDEETESYDQPVIVRLGTRDESELRDGFPKTKEALYEYHAVVLDDIEAAFFSHDQLSLLERYVSERGGAVLMLGGPDAFHHGGYARTPLADVLPVYSDRPAEDRRTDFQSVQASGTPAPSARDGLEIRPTKDYRLNLTRDGWLQPWVRLRSTEPDEERRLAEMPGFRTLTRVREIKPAARVLATVRDPSGKVSPALVAQQYGDGRAAAMLVGDLWRWTIARDEGQPDDLAKAWRQTVRWLVADVPKRVSAGAVPVVSGTATAMQIKVRVRDNEFQPLDNAAAKVTITPPEGPPIELTAEPSLKEPGVFEATYVPREPGGYRAEAVATDDSGAEAGRAEVGWTSDPAADEFRAIDVNQKLLQDLAETTGGELVPSSDLASFVETLPTRRVPVMETWTSPLWHHAWVLLLAVLCLAGEWGLRRWRGMP
jgi:uncharacterized membrane protein